MAFRADIGVSAVGSSIMKYLQRMRGVESMWLFSTTGFISVVRQEDSLLVRSRDRASLVPISQYCGSAIEQTPLADYPYRTVVSIDKFSSYVALQVTEIDYRNFKSEVEITLGGTFSRPLNKVWDVMHEVEDKGARIR